MFAADVGEPLDVGQDRDRRRLARGELGLKRDIRIAALDAGRVDLGTRDALLEPQERAAGDQQDGEGGNEDGDRPTHHGMGDALPTAGSGDFDAVGDRPEAVPKPGQGQGVDAMAEHPQHRRKERQGEDHRAHDDERTGDTDRADGRRDEQQQARQPDGDRDAAERDGLARRRDRAFDRFGDGPAATQLLAEPADDEQRIVDGEGEAEHRRDVQDEDAHLDLLGHEVDQGEAARDREPGDEERHAGRDDRGEDEDEHDRDDGQRHELGLLEVLLGLLGGVLGDRPVARQGDGVSGLRRQRRPNRIDERDGVLIGDVELDDDVGGVTGRADEAPVAGLGVPDHALHLGHRGQAGCRGVDRLLELGGRRVRARRLRPEERDDRALPRAELGVETGRDRGGFGVRVEPAAGRQNR